MYEDTAIWAPFASTTSECHLVTVGLVPWSLDRPGITSGFVPMEIVSELDFIAVHLYPEKGKVYQQSAGRQVFDGSQHRFPDAELNLDRLVLA